LPFCARKVPGFPCAVSAGRKAASRGESRGSMSVRKPNVFAFHRAEHLRRPAEFRRVYERRRSASDAWLIVYGCENGLSFLRLGLSVSRKVGGATKRNRLRRLYREAFRLTRSEMPAGLDLVLIPRTPELPSLEELKRSLPKLVRQIARKLAREASSS